MNKFGEVDMIDGVNKKIHASKISYTFAVIPRCETEREKNMQSQNVAQLAKRAKCGTFAQSISHSEYWCGMMSLCFYRIDGGAAVEPNGKNAHVGSVCESNDGVQSTHVGMNWGWVGAGVPSWADRHSTEIDVKGFCVCVFAFDWLMRWLDVNLSIMCECVCCVHFSWSHCGSCKETSDRNLCYANMRVQLKIFEYVFMFECLQTNTVHTHYVGNQLQKKHNPTR